MNISKMKNIIVLKDLPSNIVDEAIVILKNNSKIKKKETIENRTSNKSEENLNGNYELIVKEAEFVIQDYIKKMETPREIKNNIKRMTIKYKRLQICSFLLGITMLIGIIINLTKAT